jgi:O-antigen ligase
MIPLSILAGVTTVRHGLHAFSFEWSNFVMQPYFFNHVIYGAVVALFLPFAFYSTQWFRKKSFAWYFSWFSTGMLFIGAVLSYGRAAWVCVLVMPVIVFLVRRKLFERLVYVALVAGALMVGFLLKDNAFYQFAPEYKSTVFHSGDLEGHLSATFEGSEISSMERFYRWVAAKNMIAARPIIGFGPSTFNQVYKRYADDAFRTYVSDNPEQSTTHNYFLMTFAEQGFVGGLLFLSFCIYMLIRAYRTYHVVRKTEHKNLVMAALLSLSVILLHCLLNELIEVDKVGSMFWFSMVLIHKVQVWHEEENGKPAENAF